MMPGVEQMKVNRGAVRLQQTCGAAVLLSLLLYTSTATAASTNRAATLRLRGTSTSTKYDEQEGGEGSFLLEHQEHEHEQGGSLASMGCGSDGDSDSDHHDRGREESDAGSSSSSSHDEQEEDEEGENEEDGGGSTGSGTPVNIKCDSCVKNCEDICPKRKAAWLGDVWADVQKGGAGRHRGLFCDKTSAKGEKCFACAKTCCGGPTYMGLTWKECHCERNGIDSLSPDCHTESDQHPKP